MCFHSIILVIIHINLHYLFCISVALSRLIISVTGKVAEIALNCTKYHFTMDVLYCRKCSNNEQLSRLIHILSPRLEGSNISCCAVPLRFTDGVVGHAVCFEAGLGVS